MPFGSGRNRFSIGNLMRPCHIFKRGINSFQQLVCINRIKWSWKERLIDVKNNRPLVFVTEKALHALTQP